MATPTSTDTEELAKFGYKQELDRSLGLFSSFAAGFSYISIMTGVFELFFFGYLSGGPAMIWTWPAVFVGQFLVALCFAELAGQFPLAGSVYQWSKQIAKPFTSFYGGWILTVGSVVTLAAVAVAYQIVAPQIWSGFEIIGGKADIGLVSTPGGAKNALLLAAALVVFTTIINMVGRQDHGPDQQLRRLRRAGRRHAADHPAGRAHPPRSRRHLRHVRPRERLSVRLLRRVPGGGADERVRDVRIRHGRFAGRGDPRPAEERPARDPPRAGRGRSGGLPGHLVRRDVGAEHPRLRARHLRAALPGQGHARHRDRRRVP